MMGYKSTQKPCESWSFVV